MSKRQQDTPKRIPKTSEEKKEVRRIYNQKWRAANPDKINKYNQRWRNENPIESRILNVRGFARQIDTEKNIYNKETFVKPREIRDLLPQYENKCKGCETELCSVLPRFYIDAVDRNLGHTKDNCFITCYECLKKNDVKLSEQQRDIAVHRIFTPQPKPVSG